MVEGPRDCVLQWAGHAGYITERFSGLLARQALVDVTLVCEEQKLRVHKLVLASNSVYFEEILQQDLGQEPIIFLKDLNFEILKAMVEFMYCGETTISQQLLPSLLAATNTFKVKELESVIEAMMMSNVSSEISMSAQAACESNINTVSNDTNYVHVKCSNIEKEECTIICNNSNNDTYPNENQSLESNTIIDATEIELEHTLYEESQDGEVSERQLSTPLLISTNLKKEQDKNSLIPLHCTIKDRSKKCSENSEINDNICYTDDELKPILYEQCCDFSDMDECEKASISLSQSCLQQTEKELAPYSFENSDVPPKIGKCVKVYSHKRRKSTDDVKNKLAHVNNVVPNPPSTDCIDLLDEPSNNDIPVTLLTSLDMESAEYIISLSTESIQSIVGAQVTDQRALIKCKEIEDIIDYDNQKENVNKKELNAESAESSEYAKPILRRSLRLNQHDSEETSNESTKESAVGEKHLKKSYIPSNSDSCIKGKRKIKDMDRKVPEPSINSIVVQSTKRNSNNPRPHKNANKLIVKRSNKSTCTVLNKEKEEQKVKMNNKPKGDTLEKIEVNSATFMPAKLNTIEHINRALWGDMSDILEDCEDMMDLSELTPHTEIPFAVGLLPLRTALEKMQATPDYQPRKTRSSVAPIKQDTNNLKRKNYSYFDTAIVSKKQNSTIGHPKENANTVCHIQIRTTPSPCIRNRKKFLSTNIATIESSTVVNRQ